MKTRTWLSADTLRPMPIYALGADEPIIDAAAYVHPDAMVIGSVEIGALSSVWPGAVLRGDGGYIRVGEQTSIQDNAVLHTTPEWPTTIGSRCVIGHLVHLEGCTIDDEVMVGNAAMVLHRSIVETGSVIAANSVVLNDVVVPSGALAAGSPAVIKPGRARIEDIRDGVEAYVDRIEQYRTGLRRID